MLGSELEAYSNVDEIGMDGFCLMAGSSMQDKACEKLSRLSKECGGALDVSLGKFLKMDKPTTSQDGACSVAIKEQEGRITCMPQMVEEGIAEGSSSSLYIVQVILVARLKSLRYPLHFLLTMLEKCVVINLMIFMMPLTI